MKKTLLKSMLVAAMLAMGLGVQAKEDVTTQYVNNADLENGQKDGSKWTLPGWTLLNDWVQDWQKATDDTHVNVVEFYAGWGSLEKTEYAMTQTIHLPQGYYRLSVNAFYRQGNEGNGTNKDKAYIFAGDKKQNVYALANFNDICKEKGYVGSSDLWKASNGFYNGDFVNEFDFTMEADGDIEIGFKGIFDEMRSWVILGPVKLYKYTLDDYLADYDKKVTEEATPLLEKPMAASVKAALQAAMVDKSTLTDVDQVTAATQALNEAIQNANNSIAAYEKIKAAIEKVATIDPDLDLAAIWADYNDGKYQSADEIYPAFQKLEAAKLGTEPNTDYTKVIINPSFEWGNTDGWTVQLSGDTGAKQNSNATFTVNNADGDYVFNTWSGNKGFPISQTIKGLPEGKYKMEALIATDAGKKVNLIGNNKKVAVDAHADGKAEGVYGEVEFNVTDGTATIGAEGVDDIWYKVDDFHLTYLGELAVEDVEIAPESGDIAEALATATAYKKVGNITINLTKDAEYTVGATLTAPNDIIINGNGAKIDASALNAPFVAFASEPKAPFLNETDFYGIENVKIEGVTVTGLKNSIIYDNNKKYCVVNLTIDNCVLGLATEEVQNEALISFKAGGANNFTISNSTVYGNKAVAKYFIRYNNNSRIDRYGFTGETDTWSFTYTNNTFYNLLIADGQWGNYNGVAAKAGQLILTVKDNIWYDCDSQTMRRMNQSKNFSNFNAASSMQNNTFWSSTVENNVLDQGSYGNGTDLTTDPSFKDAAKADFAVEVTTAQAENKTGDQRWGTWKNESVGISNVEKTTVNNGVVYDLQGRRVAQPTKGLYIINGKKVIK